MWKVVQSFGVEGSMTKKDAQEEDVWAEGEARVEEDLGEGKCLAAAD